MFGSGGKQNTAKAVLWVVIIDSRSVDSHEQTKKLRLLVSNLVFFSISEGCISQVISRYAQ